jgi:hypothetical protein
VIELLEHRTMHGKTHILPDGRIQVESSVAPMHWDDDGKWIEVDCTPVSHDGGETWTTTSTPYEMLWDVQTFTLSFKRKKGGNITLRLVALDGLPPPRQFHPPEVSGNSVKSWVVPEFEIELRTRSNDVEIFKILHGPKAPRKITWEVTESSPGVTLRLMETTGRDNILKLAPRTGEINRHRPVEILHTREDINERTYRVTEEFTERTRFIDPATRARSWVNEVEWPVEIDVTVTVLVTADQDDGNGREYDYWRANNFQVRAPSYARYAAARFLSVNVPQGQTLDSATFTVNVTFRSGSQSATLSGQNVDTAPTWINTSAFSPKTMAKTTANVVTATPAATGLFNIDVKAICQEILNRAGWAANNNIRLGWTTVSGMTTSYMDFEDFADSGANPAKLVIVYTVASAGNIAWIKA